MYKQFYFLINTVKSTRDFAQTWIFRHSLPVQPSSDDVWIVEFPKSGITWLSFLIANINSKMSGRDQKVAVNFFNINDFVADIHSHRSIPNSTQYPGFRFIKSHSTYNPFYHKVIYLVRDPRAVMISYHKFLMGIKRQPGSLSSLIRSKRFGIEAWAYHVSSWIEEISMDKRIYFVRYEDLKDNTSKTMSDLYTHMGLFVPESTLLYAVEKASRENMTHDEKQWKSGDIKYRDAYSGFQFVGEEKSKSYADLLSPSDLDYISHKAGHLMEQFGYPV